jgi:hypothetical protein
MVLNFQNLNKPEIKLYTILGSLIFFLVVKEAYILPLTHDEGNTIYCSTTSIWDIITFKDPVPNNHILNTLFIKLSTALLGDGLFASRLHNTLSFLLFYIFTILISRRLFSNLWLQATLVVIMVLQPFLLDFFSVTRGYGLSIAFQTVSLYYLVKRWQEGKGSDLFYSILWAAVGVYANFTVLNYYVPLCILLLAQSGIKNFKGNTKQLFRDFGVIFGCSLVLLSLIIIPVHKMVSTKQFVYWGNTGFIHDTVKPLIIALRSGVDYYGATNEEIQMVVISLITIISLAGLSISFFQKKFSTHLVLLTILLISVIGFNIFLFYAMDVPFLNARTALFFVPLVCIPFVLSIDSIFLKYRTLGMILIIGINSLFVQHFIRGFKVNSNFEWYYDKNTYEVLDYIKELAESGQVSKPVKVNCYWIFYPSMSFHAEHHYKDVIEIMPWNTKIENDQTSLFYYTEASEKDKLSVRFDIVKEYEYGARYLLRAKSK